MNSSSSQTGRWHSRIEPTAAPQSTPHESRCGEHAVQFYEYDEALISAVAVFVGSGIGAGDSALIIASRAHCEAIELRLMTHGLSVAGLKARKQLVTVDAVEFQSRFMVDGSFNEGTFLQSMSNLLNQSLTPGRGLRVFGELVALQLAAGNFEAVFRIEELWNELLASPAIERLCAYPMSLLASASHAGVFDRICREHSKVIPTESYCSKPTVDARLREICRLQQMAASTKREVAESSRLQTALKEEHATLQMAMGMAGLGSWEYHLVGNRLVCSPRARAILGIRFIDETGADCLLQGVHPEDRVSAVRRLKAALEDAKDHEDEFRMLDSSGNERWVKLTCRISSQDGGRIVGFVRELR